MRKFCLTLLLIIAAGRVMAEPFAWSVNSNGIDSATSDSLYRIDLATGESTRVNKVRPNDRNINSDIEGLAIGTDGRLYAVDDADESLLVIDTATGLGSPVNGNPFNLKLPAGKNYDFGLTFTCQGALLLASDDNQSLYFLDNDLGEATLIGNSSSLNAPITALASWGGVVYGLGQGSENNKKLAPNLYKIDIDTGTSTLIGALGREAKPYVNGGLSFDADGQLWALTDRFNVNGQDLPSQILKIDPVTGKATAVAESPVIGFESLAIAGPGGCQVTEPDTHVRDAAPVPVFGLPASIILLLSMLVIGGLSLRGR